MPQPYIVINHHEPEECASLEPGFTTFREHLNGKDFYCPCPFGEHSYYMIVEGDSSDEVIAGLPTEWRKGTRAIPIEIFHLSR